VTRSRAIEYLDHIFQAACRARQYVEQHDRQMFLADERTQQAVILNLVIIGEAAARLIANHLDFVEQHDEIPWQRMRGMRNRLAHGYFDIDLDMVWKTVQTDLTSLIDILPPIQVMLRDQHQA